MTKVPFVDMLQRANRGRWAFETTMGYFFPGGRVACYKDAEGMILVQPEFGYDRPPAGDNPTSLRFAPGEVEAWLKKVAQDPEAADLVSEVLRECGYPASEPRPEAD